MKTAKIEISATESLFSNIINVATAQAFEIRDHIARQREEARCKARLQTLNNHLRKDIGMEPTQNRDQDIDRNWML